MATTTNYSWTTPDDTDLVKDGAAAIRTLGSSIDTTTKALNPETTLGDIAYRSSTANTNTRLALGTAGQVLTVNSGATAPEWATPASGGMTLINTGGTTLSGATTTISSIPATFIDLVVVVRNYRPATDNQSLKMRFNGDSNINRHKSISTTTADNVEFDDTSVQITAACDNGASNSLSVSTIYNYSNTATFKMSKTHASVVPDGVTATNIDIATFQGYYKQTDAISSLVFLPNSGNFTSGTVFLYGVK